MPASVLRGGGAPSAGRAATVSFDWTSDGILEFPFTVGRPFGCKASALVAICLPGIEELISQHQAKFTPLMCIASVAFEAVANLIVSVYEGAALDHPWTAAQHHGNRSAHATGASWMVVRSAPLQSVHGPPSVQARRAESHLLRWSAWRFCWDLAYWRSARWALAGPTFRRTWLLLRCLRLGKILPVSLMPQRWMTSVWSGGCCRCCLQRLLA